MYRWWSARTFELTRVASFRHVTDVHLVAVARRHGASLATLDRGIATLAGGEDVTLVPLT